MKKKNKPVTNETLKKAKPNKYVAFHDEVNRITPARKTTAAEKVKQLELKIAELEKKIDILWGGLNF